MADVVPHRAYYVGRFEEVVVENIEVSLLKTERKSFDSLSSEAYEHAHTLGLYSVGRPSHQHGDFTRKEREPVSTLKSSRRRWLTTLQASI